MAKSKTDQAVNQSVVQQVANRQQLERARQAHAKGAIGTEDYIWAAMQCYAAEIRANSR